MKTLIGCAIFMAMAWMAHAQTQDSVIAETGSQIICSLKQVKVLANFLKGGLNYKFAAMNATLNFDYDEYNQYEVSVVNSYLIPIQTGITNFSVLNSLINVNAVVTAIRTRLGVIRELGLLVKSNVLKSILARIDLWVAQDLSNFQHAIMRHILNKFADDSIVVANVASCRQTAFTVFDATFQNSSDTMNNCAGDMQKVYINSQLISNDIYGALKNALLTLITTTMNTCMANNAIENAWAMDWVTDVQRDGFIACINQVSTN